MLFKIYYIVDMGEISSGMKTCCGCSYLARIYLSMCLLATSFMST